MKNLFPFASILLLLSSCLSHQEEANKLFEEGDYEGAAYHYEWALKFDPDNWHLLYNLAGCKEELGYYDEGIDLYRESLRLNNELIEAFLGRARCYWKKEDLTSAIIDFSNVLKRDQNHFEAQYSRGKCYLQDSLYYRALLDFNKAINLNRAHVNSYYHRAIARATLKDNFGAINDMNYVIRSKENFSKAYFNRGIIYQRMNRFAEAINDFTRAIDLNFKNCDVYIRRGMCNLISGDPQKACMDFKSASEYDKEQGTKAIMKFCL